MSDADTIHGTALRWLCMLAPLGLQKLSENSDLSTQEKSGMRRIRTYDQRDIQYLLNLLAPLRATLTSQAKDSGYWHTANRLIDQAKVLRANPTGGLSVQLARMEKDLKKILRGAQAPKDLAPPKDVAPLPVMVTVKAGETDEQVGMRCDWKETVKKHGSMSLQCMDLLTLIVEYEIRTGARVDLGPLGNTKRPSEAQRAAWPEARGLQVGDFTMEGIRHLAEPLRRLTKTSVKKHPLPDDYRQMLALLQEDLGGPKEVQKRSNLVGGPDRDWPTWNNWRTGRNLAAGSDLLRLTWFLNHEKQRLILESTPLL